MTGSGTRAQRTFTVAAQHEFARTTGDCNPLHFDVLVARRTQAGAPVVHGMAQVLWALESLAPEFESRGPIRRLRVRFLKFVYLDETAQLQLIDSEPQRARLRIVVDGATVTQITIELGEPTSDCDWTDRASPLVTAPTVAIEREWDELIGCSGRLPFTTPPSRASAMFPAATTWLTAARTSALATCSTLIGMVCPGERALFAGFDLSFSRAPLPAEAVHFRVESTTPSVRMLKLTVAGGGIVGELECLLRSGPTRQASMGAVARIVRSDEFTGSTALVVGGSRGLGELTAKLIAAGGGRVILTYNIGKFDADGVVSEIRAAGGDCEAMPYDARQPAGPQLAHLTCALTQLHFFATPALQTRQSPSYDARRLHEFLAVYVDGFRDLVETLRTRNPQLSVFYPSATSLDEPPRSMVEFLMAKAAAEILCMNLNETLAPLRVFVRRLPRLATDQTTSVVAVETASAPDTLLPIVREVHAWKPADCKPKRAR